MQRHAAAAFRVGRRLFSTPAPRSHVGTMGVDSRSFGANPAVTSVLSGLDMPAQIAAPRAENATLKAATRPDPPFKAPSSAEDVREADEIILKVTKLAAEVDRDLGPRTKDGKGHRELAYEKVLVERLESCSELHPHRDLKDVERQFRFPDPFADQTQGRPRFRIADLIVNKVLVEFKKVDKGKLPVRAVQEDVDQVKHYLRCLAKIEVGLLIYFSGEGTKIFRIRDEGFRIYEEDPRDTVADGVDSSPEHYAVLSAFAPPTGAIDQVQRTFFPHCGLAIQAGARESNAQ